ncbi:MAG: hypothetical protein H0T89_05965 [Deltaproteobacteria bacterium]|nr:hypothetical protein [Deltaproteobacteria bacterium]MDQ3299858.1 hypothetical protein [Myxococcota bacterium]
MIRSIALACVMCAVIFPASVAIASPGPQFAAGLDYTVGTGGSVDELDLGWRLEAGLFVRVGRWQVTASVPWHPHIESSNPERDSPQLMGVGLSGRLGYHLPVDGHGRIVIAGGVTRRWISSSTAVMRTCSLTGDCIAGFDHATPSYHAWAPQLRIGIGPEKLMREMVLATSFELIIEAIGLNDVPPAGIREVAVMAGVTFTIGGGPQR